MRLAREDIWLVVQFSSVNCFAINCTKARKTNYLNTNGEEAKGKPPGLQGVSSLS